MGTLEMKNQGLRLKLARIEAGYGKASDAARECRWSAVTYRAHENGTRRINFDTAQKYARAFSARGAKVTAQAILFGPAGQSSPAASAIEKRPTQEKDTSTPMQELTYEGAPMLDPNIVAAAVQGVLKDDLGYAETEAQQLAEIIVHTAEELRVRKEAIQKLGFSAKPNRSSEPAHEG